MFSCWSCNGTADRLGNIAGQIDRKSVRDLGVVINFSGNTVSFQDHTFPILSVDTASITFKDEQPGGERHEYRQDKVLGIIDRVTGAVTVKFYVNTPSWSFETWELQCRLAKRLF